MLTLFRHMIETGRHVANNAKNSRQLLLYPLSTVKYGRHYNCTVAQIAIAIYFIQVSKQETVQHQCRHFNPTAETFQVLPANNFTVKPVR
jgi:hypothetical protein